MNVDDLADSLAGLRVVTGEGGTVLLGQAAKAVQRARSSGRATGDLPARLDRHAQALERLEPTTIYSDGPQLKRDVLAALQLAPELVAESSARIGSLQPEAERAAAEIVAGVRNVGVGIDLGIRTPGEILAEMNVVRGLAESLDRDITAASSPASPAFLESWSAFYRELLTWHSERSGWWDRVGGAAWDRAQEYRQRLAEWRRAFEKRGGHPSERDPDFDSKGATKWIVGGVATAIVLGGLAYAAYRGARRG